MASRDHYFTTVGVPVFLVAREWLEALENYRQLQRDWPGPVHNLQLIAWDCPLQHGSKRHLNYQLEKGLKENRDFQVVSKSHWNYLLKIFGGI